MHRPVSPPNMMKLTSIASPLTLILRATQGVFAALVLVLSGFGETLAYPNPSRTAQYPTPKN